MSSLRTLLLCLAGGTFFAAAANALPDNPLVPGAPLSVHTATLCPGLSDFATGTDRATCSGSNVVENSTTLTHVTGTGVATSDLRTGTLHSRGTSQAFSLGEDHLHATATSQGELYDTITIGGSFAGTVELRMAVEGSLLVSPTAIMRNRVQGWLFTFDDAGNVIESAAVRIDQAAAVAQPPGIPTLTRADVVGQGSITTNADAFGFFFDPSNVTFVLSLFIQVAPSNPSFSFVAHLDTVADAFAASDEDRVVESDVNFGNTAQLAVIVPAGVTWTSASGAFLVPEPASLMLLAALGAALRLSLRRAR